MERYEIDGFKFNKLFNHIDIVASRVKDGYVEYRIVNGGGRFKWVKRYEIVWQYYKKEKRRFGFHIHHTNMNKLDDRPNNLKQITRLEHTAIHGKVYNAGGHGGSKRMLGNRHDDEVRKKMSIQMIGNKNLPTKRNKAWCDRIRDSKTRLKKGTAIKDKIMRKVVYMYCRENKSYRSIADEFKTSKQTIMNRLSWFMEDNNVGSKSFNDLRKFAVLNNLNDCKYYDEEYKVDIDRETIRLRFMYLKTPEDICKKLKINIKEFDRTIERFIKVNRLNGLFNYQIHKFVVDKGMDKVKIKLKEN